MLILEEITVQTGPEHAWELLSDPSCHGLWIPHIVATKASSHGPAGRGFRYRVTYEMAGRRSEFDAEVTEFEPPLMYGARLSSRVQGLGQRWDREVFERYRIEARESGCHVRHEVQIDLRGVNPLIRGLIWVLSRFGRPRGLPFLQKFRRVAESEVQTGAARAA